jgi:membrane protease YdiL (CAAX protease family)
MTCAPPVRHALPENVYECGRALLMNSVWCSVYLWGTAIMKKLDAQHLDLPVLPSRINNARLTLLIFAWAATLLVSSLPSILSQELQVFTALPFLHVRVILLLGFIALGFFWKPARLLRPYFILFLALFLADAFFTWVGTTPLWQQGFAGIRSAFTRDMVSAQVLRLAVACVMILSVWFIHPRWARFLLSKGKLAAPAEPVRWLGMDQPMRWSRFGLILSVCITLGTLAFLILSGSPSGDFISRIIPLLPIVLVISAMNAFSEEITYRAALLAPLRTALGKSQSLLLTAALFGLWHYYGIPYGVVGVIMAAGLGWLLGKSMLETKGIFWAWFIHFWQDVAIFAFIAAGSIATGG